MRTELDRKKSTFGNHDITVVAYRSSVLDEDLMMMLEVPEGADVQTITHAFSITRTGNDMHTHPLPPIEMLASLVSPYMGEGKVVVIGGLGGGSLHTALASRYPGTIVSVEPDETVVEMARKYWGFEGDVRIARFEDTFEAFGEVDCFVLNMSSNVMNINARELFDQDLMLHLLSYVKPGGAVIINGLRKTKMFDESYLGVEQKLHIEQDPHSGDVIRYQELIKRPLPETWTDSKGNPNDSGT